MATSYEKHNLIYLEFASNSCYHNVSDRPPSGIVIDLEKGAWKWKPSLREERCFRIGECDPQARVRGAKVIGIYDRTRVDHLDAMVHHATELVRDGYRSALDD
jgi:hypothetical protein